MKDTLIILLEKTNFDERQYQELYDISEDEDKEYYRGCRDYAGKFAMFLRQSIEYIDLYEKR